MKALKVIHTESGKVVRTIDVSGKSDCQIDTVERGLLRNMNTNKYHVFRATNEAA